LPTAAVVDDRRDAVFSAGLGYCEAWIGASVGRSRQPRKRSRTDEQEAGKRRGDNPPPQGWGWCAQYTVYTAEGRKWKTLYGKTKAEVATKLAKALSDREGGISFESVNLKIGEYLEQWLKDSVCSSVKQRTFENYVYVVRSHLMPALGHMKVKVLAPAHVQGLYSSKLESGLSPRTVQLIHTTLHKALKQAVSWDLVPRNVTEAVQAPRPAKNAKKEMHPLSAKQARCLLEAARGDRLEALYVLAITTGLREGELLGLRWQDVNLESGTLSVHQ
jgi:integrase